MAKAGRLKNNEKEYILKNCTKLTAEQIAKKIDRTVEWVTAFIKDNYRPETPANEQEEKVVIRQDLRASEKWKRLIQELTKDEISYFEEEYIKLYAQFRSDVLPSEEGQIFDAIKLDLLKSRNMIERRRARDEISRMERQMENFVKTKGDDAGQWDQADRDFFTNLNNHLVASRVAEQSKTTEFVKLQERYDKLMENLKATRGQRFKEVESGKETFLGLLKRLTLRDIKEAEGRQAGLVKLSAQKEYERLGRPHEYENGELDRPILSADTVDLEPEPEEESNE